MQLTLMRTLFPFRSTSVIASLLERDIVLKSDWYSNCRVLEQVTEGVVVVEEVFIGKTSTHAFVCCDVNPTMKLGGLPRALVAQAKFARDQRDLENQRQSLVLFFTEAFDAKATICKTGKSTYDESRLSTCPAHSYVASGEV